MRIFDGTIYRDMTAEEIEQWQQSMSDTPAPEPTAEERIAALEARQDDTDALLVELAYNQTLMELGLTE